MVYSLINKAGQEEVIKKERIWCYILTFRGRIEFAVCPFLFIDNKQQQIPAKKKINKCISKFDSHFHKSPPVTMSGEVSLTHLNIPTALKAASDCTAYAPWRRAKMAASNVEPEYEWSDRALDIAEDTLVAMETLLATLRAFEDVLRQQEISTASSTEYCDNFCQVCGRATSKIPEG